MQGVPGGAQEKKKSSGAPPPEKKQGRREKNRPGRGMGIKKKPVVPRLQRKSREEERKSVPGGAWGSKRSLWCPAVREKAGKKRGNPSRAGHRRRKRAVVPRRQRKSREEEGKSVPGGAWGAKEACDAPPSEKKQGRRGKIRPGRGMEEQKEALIPRLPSINRPA